MWATHVSLPCELDVSSLRGNGHRSAHGLGSSRGRDASVLRELAPPLQFTFPVASQVIQVGMSMTVKPTPPSANREKVRATVPKLIGLTEQVLFGDIWERPALSKRDRSLITCAALVALNRTEQLKGHLERALNNGVTADEIGELITHLAFYGGWPVAMSAAMVAKDVLAQRKA